MINMAYNWSKMVTITVPVGLNGWLYSGQITINGITTKFPVGVETSLPEPVAAMIQQMIAVEEDNEVQTPDNLHTGSVTIPAGKTLKLEAGAMVEDEAGVLGAGGGGSGVAVDATLTQEGMAADAKETGRRIGALSEEIADLGGGASTPEQESAPLGAELASASGWTTDGWTGDFASGFTHTAGNTNPLIFTMPEATGTKLYLVEFSLDSDPGYEGSYETGAKDGMWVQLGNSSYFDLYNETSPHRVGIRSVSDGNLQFNPAANFAGTISGISVKEITGTFPAPISKKDSDEDVAYEVRPTKADQYNLFFGLESGQYNISGHDNVGVGAETLKSNTSGYRNVAVGHGAQEQMTVGSRNVAIGHLSMQKMASGQRNVAIGNACMTNLQHGHQNIAIGADAMYGVSDEVGNNIAIGKGTLYNVSGDENIGIGPRALYDCTANKNIAIGSNALHKTTGGANIAIGQDALYNKGSGQGNIAIGATACKGVSGATQQNNVCIGYLVASALGSASNNVIIGAAAGSQLSTGSKNILIGKSVEAPSATQNNWINIGDVYQGSWASDNMYASIRGGLEVTGLPTSDPGIAGRFWNDGGTVKVSAG